MLLFVKMIGFILGVPFCVLRKPGLLKDFNGFSKTMEILMCPHPPAKQKKTAPSIPKDWLYLLLLVLLVLSFDVIDRYLFLIVLISKS